MNTCFAPTTLSTTLSGVTFHISTYLPEIIRAEHDEAPRVHMHHSDEFFYIYAGQLRLLYADQKRELILKKGDLCVIPKGMYHCPHIDYTERICFESRMEIIPTDPSPAACLYRGIQQKLTALEVPYVIRSAYIDTIMEHYRALAHREAPALPVNGASILLCAAMYAFESMQAEPVMPDPKKTIDTELDARRILIERYICEHFFDSACLANLAEALCLSQRQTSSVVQEIMHRSFKELIVAERMRVADILIRNRQYTLEQIAEIVGYRSYSGFFTAYRKCYGTPPGNPGSPKPPEKQK